jgi:hypothetical protein
MDAHTSNLADPTPSRLASMRNTQADWRSFAGAALVTRPGRSNPGVGSSERLTAMDGPIDNVPNTPAWTTVQMLDDFATVCCPEHPHLELRSDPDSFSLTQRRNAFRRN